MIYRVSSRRVSSRRGLCIFLFLLSSSGLCGMNRPETFSLEGLLKDKLLKVGDQKIAYEVMRGMINKESVQVLDLGFPSKFVELLEKQEEVCSRKIKRCVGIFCDLHNINLTSHDEYDLKMALTEELVFDEFGESSEGSYKNVITFATWDQYVEFLLSECEDLIFITTDKKILIALERLKALCESHVVIRSSLDFMCNVKIGDLVDSCSFNYLSRVKHISFCGWPFTVDHFSCDSGDSGDSGGSEMSMISNETGCEVDFGLIGSLINSIKSGNCPELDYVYFSKDAFNHDYEIEDIEIAFDLIKDQYVKVVFH